MIKDENQRIVGFQGRRKDDSLVEVPKMYNLKGFDKSKVIYNFNNSKDSDAIILFEGPGDCCKAVELCNGKTLFASLMGGELSSYQIKLLEEYNFKNKQIYICLDNDGPGKMYAKKIAKKLLKRGFNDIYLTHVLTKKDVGSLKDPYELALVIRKAAVKAYLKGEKLCYALSFKEMLKERKEALELIRKKGKTEE